MNEVTTFIILPRLTMYETLKL